MGGELAGQERASAEPADTQPRGLAPWAADVRPGRRPQSAARL